MKKLFLTGIAAFGLLFVQTETKAQEYKNALGVRLGSYNGINFKTFVSEDNAFDLNLSFRNTSARKDVRFTVLYELHNPVQNAPGLKWYYGGGGSIGSRRYVSDDGQLFLSAVGTLGLDYTFTGAPINLALDWRPQLVITPDTDVTAGDVGLAIRFTF